MKKALIGLAFAASLCGTTSRAQGREMKEVISVRRANRTDLPDAVKTTIDPHWGKGTIFTIVSAEVVEQDGPITLHWLYKIASDNPKSWLKVGHSYRWELGENQQAVVLVPDKNASSTTQFRGKPSRVKFLILGIRVER